MVYRCIPAVNQPSGSIAKGFFVDMCLTCMYAFHMSKMIQIRNVPDSLHRKLKARAAMAGKSLSDYLIAEITHLAERPTLSELRERLRSRMPVNPHVPPSQAVREDRDAR